LFKKQKKFKKNFENEISIVLKSYCYFIRFAFLSYLFLLSSIKIKYSFCFYYDKSKNVFYDMKKEIQKLKFKKTKLPRVIKKLSVLPDCQI